MAEPQFLFLPKPTLTLDEIEKILWRLDTQDNQAGNNAIIYGSEVFQNETIPVDLTRYIFRVFNNGKVVNHPGDNTPLNDLLVYPKELGDYLHELLTQLLEEEGLFATHIGAIRENSQHPNAVAWEMLFDLIHREKRQVPFENREQLDLFIKLLHSLVVGALQPPESLSEASTTTIPTESAGRTRAGFGGLGGFGSGPTKSDTTASGASPDAGGRDKDSANNSQPPQDTPPKSTPPNKLNELTTFRTTFQNQTAWIQGQVLYTFFTQHGIQPNQVPRELQEFILSEVTTSVISLSPQDVQNLIANPMGRFALVQKIFSKLNTNPYFLVTLENFYQHTVDTLPLEQAQTTSQSLNTFITKEGIQTNSTAVDQSTPTSPQGKSGDENENENEYEIFLKSLDKNRSDTYKNAVLLLRNKNISQEQVSHIISQVDLLIFTKASPNLLLSLTPNTFQLYFGVELSNEQIQELFPILSELWLSRLGKLASFNPNFSANIAPYTYSRAIQDRIDEKKANYPQIAFGKATQLGQAVEASASKPQDLINAVALSEVDADTLLGDVDQKSKYEIARRAYLQILNQQRIALNNQEALIDFVLPFDAGMETMDSLMVAYPGYLDGMNDQSFGDYSYLGQPQPGLLSRGSNLSSSAYKKFKQFKNLPKNIRAWKDNLSSAKEFLSNPKAVLSNPRQFLAKAAAQALIRPLFGKTAGDLAEKLFNTAAVASIVNSLVGALSSMAAGIAAAAGVIGGAVGLLLAAPLAIPLAIIAGVGTALGAGALMVNNALAASPAGAVGAGGAGAGGAGGAGAGGAGANPAVGAGELGAGNQGLFGGAGAQAGLALGGGCCLVGAAALMTQSAFLHSLPTITDNQISPYINIEKAVSPDRIAYDNGENPSIVYTITITPKDGYTIEITDISDVLSVKYNATTQPGRTAAVIKTRTGTDFGFPDISFDNPVTVTPESPLVLPGYTESFPSNIFVDANITNTVTITLNATKNGLTETDKIAKTAQIICIGECPQAQNGCWPATGYLIQTTANEQGTHDDVYAIDIRNTIGTPVYATFTSSRACTYTDGMATGIGAVYGNHALLKIDPGVAQGAAGSAGFSLLYGHMNQFSGNFTANSCSNAYQAGAEVGQMGISGLYVLGGIFNSSGNSHLHYEVRPLSGAGGKAVVDAAGIQLEDLLPAGEMIQGTFVRSCYDQ